MWWMSKVEPKPTLWMRLKKPIIYSATSITLLLLSIIFFAPEIAPMDGFQNLAVLNAYAQSKNENIKPDTANTIRPIFDSYYETIKPTLKTKIKRKFDWALSFVGLHTQQAFSASFFKAQLESLFKIRQEQGYTRNSIVKIQTSPQSQFVIFGNVQGAFHSLVRDLNELKKLGIIDDNLILTSRDYYMIFIGDTVSRSPYSMETLSAVMKLMQKNPDNVIYLKGNHETANYWQEHSLKAELLIRARHLSKELTPLAEEVNALFNSLSLAAYLSTFPIEANQFIRISDEGRTENALLQENTYTKFLTEKSTGLTILDLDNKGDQSSNAQVTIAVIFKGEKKRETFQPMVGLRFLAPDMDSVAWNILSCPTMVYQIALKFFHDAFVIVKPSQELDKWTATLHNRDVRKEGEQFTATTFYLLSGVEEGASQVQQDPLTTISPDTQRAPEQKTIVPTPQPQIVAPVTVQEEPAVQIPIIKAPQPAAASAFGQPSVATHPIEQVPQAIETPTQKVPVQPQLQTPIPVSAFTQPKTETPLVKKEPSSDQQIDSEATENLEKHVNLIKKHAKEIKKIVSELKEETEEKNQQERVQKKSTPTESKKKAGAPVNAEPNQMEDGASAEQEEDPVSMNLDLEVEI